MESQSLWGWIKSKAFFSKSEGFMREEHLLEIRIESPLMLIILILSLDLFGAGMQIFQHFWQSFLAKILNFLSRNHRLKCSLLIKFCGSILYLDLSLLEQIDLIFLKSIFKAHLGHSILLFFFFVIFVKFYFKLQYYAQP